MKKKASPSDPELPTAAPEPPVDPAPEAPKPPRTKKTKRNLEYRFTSEELIDIGKELGEAIGSAVRLENDRKMVADEWKAKISAKEAEIATLGNKTSRGYEYRDLPCTVTFHDPAPTKKTTRRDDNGEIVDIRYMEESELQEELRFDEAEADAKEQAAAQTEQPID
jgi:hypothetical protein